MKNIDKHGGRNLNSPVIPQSRKIYLSEIIPFNIFCLKYLHDTKGTMLGLTKLLLLNS